MSPNHPMGSGAAWEAFAHTGKIEDYLQYRKEQQLELASWTPQAEGTVTSDAADHRRNRPAGLQN